jgi:hypothetical protein
MIINSRRFARNLKVNHKIPSVPGSEVITHDDAYGITETQTHIWFGGPL